jgi:hypothetical protein
MISTSVLGSRKMMACVSRLYVKRGRDDADSG